MTGVRDFRWALWTTVFGAANWCRDLCERTGHGDGRVYGTFHQVMRYAEARQ